MRPLIQESAHPAAQATPCLLLPAPMLSQASSSSSSSSSHRATEHGSPHGATSTAAAAMDEEEVYCAVGKEWRANLRWVLANFPRSRRLVLAHVHRPPRRINMMGAWVPVSQLAEQEVATHRSLEEDKASRALDELLHICAAQQVRARKVILSGDDAAGGLVQLVDDHAVADLVMGAASDRAYARRMRAPRSRKALTVERKADPSCRIWFICKGNLICTREAGEGQQSRASSSSTASSTSPRSAASDHSRSRSLFGGMHHDSPDPAALRRTPSRDDDTDRSVDDDAAAAAAPPAVSDEARQDDADGEAWCDRLREAVVEAESLRDEAREEARRRQKAERDLADASRTADAAESSWQEEARRRKEVEERLARERAAMEQDQRELDAILEQTREANEQSDKLELRIAESERAMSELDVRMAESYSALDALRRRRRREDHDESVSAAGGDDDGGGVSFLRLGLSELEEATNNFDESVRIGGGGGGVYRGNLLDMSVVVKVIGPDVAVDEARFTREVEAIGRVRHPNIVALVGACPEARAVVHELVPGGSLEDRLGGTSPPPPPLPWHARCGVAYQTCSALAFLHSTTVHGDVRPANILLDDDERCSASKLAGVGTRRLMAAERRPPPTGEALAYADPWYLATGEPSPQSDVHALGVVLLRLVTGRQPFAAKKAAQDAAAGRWPWQDVADATGGGWPTERAREVALLGLNLCDVRRRRPAGELLKEALTFLESTTSAAPGRTWSLLSSAADAPSYFLCPILKEVMRDPQIAGDGFTYEAAAMRQWLESGHDTSPMTNLKLPTDELVPNHALRAAIHEWRHASSGPSP